MENESERKVIECGNIARNEMLGHEEILKILYSYVDSMALKCAIELRLADIIHSYSHPITLRQLITSIISPSPDIACLERIMRLMVYLKIFTADPQPDGRETLYGPTPASRWILHDAELSLVPFSVLQTDERMFAPMHHLSSCVKENGADLFKTAHGLGSWEYGLKDPSYLELFNKGMQSTATLTLKLITDIYKDKFDQMVGSLLDIGGGTGATLAAIVKAHPHIKGINFDMPHVVATAPKYPGVSHVGGDMFKTVPNADTILMKSVLHDWTDEECIRILKNCRKSLPKDTGKLILIEMVLSSEEDDMFHMILLSDITMMAHNKGGKERTETEWKDLLAKAGFTNLNIIKPPFVLSVIEAYPY